MRHVAFEYGSENDGLRLKVQASLFTWRILHSVFVGASPVEGLQGWLAGILGTLCRKMWARGVAPVRVVDRSRSLAVGWPQIYRSVNDLARLRVEHSERRAGRRDQARTSTTTSNEGQHAEFLADRRAKPLTLGWMGFTSANAVRILDGPVPVPAQRRGPTGQDPHGEPGVISPSVNSG